MVMNISQFFVNIINRFFVSRAVIRSPFLLPLRYIGVYLYVYIYIGQGIEPFDVWDRQLFWAFCRHSASGRTTHAYIDSSK